jgi:hypothetical protein
MQCHLIQVRLRDPFNQNRESVKIIHVRERKTGLKPVAVKVDKIQ